MPIILIGCFIGAVLGVGAMSLWTGMKAHPKAVAIIWAISSFIALIWHPVPKGRDFHAVGIIGQSEATVVAAIGEAQTCSPFFDEIDPDSGKTACYYQGNTTVIYQHGRSIRITSGALDGVPYATSPEYYAVVTEHLGFDASRPVVATIDKLVWQIDGGTLTVLSNQRLDTAGITIDATS
jgi:hypothetical protein